MENLLYSLEEEKKRKQEEEARCVGIEGPTGSGKTLGMVRFIQSNPGVFGKVIMVFPTQHAMKMIKKWVKKDTPVLFLTAKTALSYIIHHSTEINSIVMDEAHHVSRDYEFLFQTIRYFYETNRYQLYFLSATLDKYGLEKLFPRINFLKIQNPSLFKTEIEYMDNSLDPHPSSRWGVQILETVKSLIALNYPYHHQRILVFLATHDQCEKYRKYFCELYPNCVVLYGNLNDVEYSQTEKLLYHSKEPFILFATNIVETAVTIPDISLIIDLCVSYQLNHNKLSLGWCDQSSLIQRAGRTGRTCNGTVIRLLSEKFFNTLSYKNNHDYNWELPILTLKMNDLDPRTIIGKKIEPYLEELIKMGILDENESIIHRDAVDFCFRSTLEMRFSLWLLKLQKLDINKPAKILIIMGTILIHLYETHNLSFLYVKNQRWNVYQKIVTVFSEKDELCIMISIFLTLFLNQDSSWISTHLSLNFKSFRTWLWHFESCFFLLYPGQSWKNILKNKLFSKPFTSKEKSFKIYSLKGYRHSISRFFFHHTNLVIKFTRPFYQDYSIDSKCIFMNIWTDYPYILVLSTKNIQKEYIVLYLFPHHLPKYFHEKLEDHLILYRIYVQEKSIYRQLFQKSLEYITQVVAYQPFKKNWEQTLEEWRLLIENWNSRQQ